MSSTNILMSASGGSTSAGDPYFENVTMLLPADGTNGAQNNTFLDSSSNNFTITRNGNTTQGTFTPYGSLWSNYFDGATSTQLTLASNAAFAFGTGAYTMEGWVYFTAAAAQISTMFDAGSTTNSISLGVAANGAVQIGKYGIGTVLGSTAGDVPLNQWVHVAACRASTSSNDTRLFVNGVLKATGTDSNNWTVTNTPVIGGINLSGYTTTGYISNLRITKGTALYTSAFTPSTTPLTSDASTSLLACQSNRFKDSSSNAFAISAYGTVSVQRFSPFNPTSAYSTSTIGGSGYFDGSSYLSTSSSAGLSGSGSFTLEAWIFPTIVSGQDNCIYETRGGSGWVLFLTSSAYLQVFDSVGSLQTASSSTVTLNQWNHVALVKNGSTCTYYINGTASGTFTLSSFAAASGVRIGTRNDASQNFRGYISNIRTVTSAVYTTAFTPPTAPLTAISGTSLLLNYTNAGIPDSAMMNDLETVGNAQISTSVKKYGTGSIAFDGTGDYLSFPSGALASLSGDYTIEAWVYLNNLSASQPILCIGDDYYSGILFFVNSSGKLGIYGNGATVATGTGTSVTTTTWTHVAFVRSGSTITLYVNGSSQGTATNSSTYTGATTLIGREIYQAGVGVQYSGYIDDLRITKGVARYTSNFTAPTEAFPLY